MTRVGGEEGDVEGVELGLRPGRWGMAWGVVAGGEDVLAGGDGEGGARGRARGGGGGEDGVGAGGDGVAGVEMAGVEVGRGGGGVVGWRRPRCCQRQGGRRGRRGRLMRVRAWGACLERIRVFGRGEDAVDGLVPGRDSGSSWLREGVMRVASQLRASG